MSFPFFVAHRYLLAKRKQVFISVVTLISTLGVMLGTMALIIVISVLGGLEEDLREKILGTNAHIVVLSHGAGMEDYQNLSVIVESFPGIKSASPFIFSQAMARSETNLTGVVIKGIDPEGAGRVTDLKNNIIYGSLEGIKEGRGERGEGREEMSETGKRRIGEGASGQNHEKANGRKTRDEGQGTRDEVETINHQPSTINHLPTPNSQPGIVIGKELSQNLGIFLGDNLDIISPLGDVTPMGMIPRVKTFIVSGIFSSGMYEYDSSFTYINLAQARDFFNMGDRVTGLEVKLDEIYSARRISERLDEALGYQYYTRTWMEMNQNLFSALKLEKVAMFIILLLITLVASFGIFSTLIMMVMEKGRDIGILKTMGATRKAIMRIFVIEGLIIGITGTILGMTCGLISCLLLKKYQFIKLPPDVYYISTLPVKLEPATFALVASCAILISLIATIYPSYRASRMDPAEAIRYE